MTKSVIKISEYIIFIWIFVLCITGAQNTDDDEEKERRNRLAATELGAPLILPIERDITLEVGGNFSLECESNEPVSWHMFHNNFGLNYEIHQSHTPDKDLPHGSILHLIGISHYYVGYYYCIKNASVIATDYSEDIESNIDVLTGGFAASNIYVYVNDSHNLIVDIEIPMVIGKQYQDVIIPCRPTSKDVSLTLTKENHEPHHFPYTFDPRNGYTVKLMSIVDSGDYMCSALNNPTDFDKRFDVIVQATGTNYINKPKIYSETSVYATEGDQKVLNCSVEVLQDITFAIEWILPNGNISLQEGRAIIGNTTKRYHPISPLLQIGEKTLTINNITKNKDQGYYKCHVVDDSANKNNDQILVNVLDKDEGTIEINEPSGSYRIEISSKKTDAKWRIKYKGHPKPQLTWYNNRNKMIPWASDNPDMDKYEVTKTDDMTILKIRYLELADSGNYTLKAQNGMVNVEKQFELVVKDKPTVKVDDAYVAPGSMTTMVCDCAGYPPSVITWSFVPCPFSAEWPSNCENTRSRMFPDEEFRTNQATTTGQRSELSFIPSEPGLVKCNAKNTEGSDSSTAKIQISDLEEPFALWGTDELIASGDTISITCGVSVYDYSDDIRWHRQEEMVQNTSNIMVTFSHTPYSYRQHITWKNVQTVDSGMYDCHSNRIKDDTWDSKSIYLNVHEATPPSIDDTNLNDLAPLKRSLGEPLRLECKFAGMPIPTIVWYKDGILIQPADNDTRVGLFDHASTLDIKFIKIEDEGEYKCEANNRLGASTKSTQLKISNIPAIKLGWIIGITALIVILVIITLYLWYRVKRERKLLREMKAAGLANFEEGNPDIINPELALDEQADLLPYDKKYEFPKEKLKLGKQLGAGAFGVVLKATAYGILPYEEETTVAVKMVKHTADNEIMRALVSELKIMVHLGQHLNVVNLLGAVTKNIAKREVMVIVEYCRFGNVQNFLIKHRDFYVDQINPETDLIDPNILTKEQRWSNDSGYEYNSSKLGAPSRKSGQPVTPGYLRSSGMGDYFPGGMDSANTEAALISSPSSVLGGEENQVMSNNSVQPAWRSNYKMDYKGPLRTITTTDLVCWSFQIARGMEYLASRKVLHGDLAARNILLCDDNVVKICDFGLARSMYKSDNYKKKGEAPLPFKWLAIESIGDQVFSTFSDVWSFGIVMWELFSLGKVPYPGMDADQGLYMKLKDGYRMEKPPNATQELYDIMLMCWSANAESRPLFSVLERILGKLLENGVAEHYIDLNEPYLQINIDQYTHGKTDYLAAMAPPEAMAPSIPTYVNSPILSKNNVPDYLEMNPNSGSVIFSPTRPTADDEIAFNYPSITTPSIVNNLDSTSPSKSSSHANKTGLPEAMPMLNKDSTVAANSDSETEASPSSRKPTTNTSPSKSYGEYRNVLNNSKDNYVNVPSTIINMDNRYNNAKDAVSNPGYVMVGKVNETRT